MRGVFLSGVVWLSTSALVASQRTQWYFPEQPAPARVYKIGDTIKARWFTNLTSYTIILQQNNIRNVDRVAVHTVEHSTVQSSGSNQGVDWLVQPYSFDFTTGNQFYFELTDKLFGFNGNTSETCGYFYLSREQANLAANATSTCNSTASGPSVDSNKSCSSKPVGIGLGLGLGIPLLIALGVAGYLFGRLNGASKQARQVNDQASFYDPKLDRYTSPPLYQAQHAGSTISEVPATPIVYEAPDNPRD